jgi:trehalose synthase
VDLSPPDVADILGVTRVMAPIAMRTDVRLDIGGVGRVDVRDRAAVVGELPISPGAPVVMQLSRWDRLKDHRGVLRGFANNVGFDLGAHLLLVGPTATSLTDDPEGVEVFVEILRAWEELPQPERERVHLVSLPIDDQVENAVVVNALQRRSDVVVQKSLAEGFGLTVAEAMWKERPLVGSRVGGIRDQIQDGRSGLLVDPTDRAALGQAISTLIRDAGFAHAIGHAARERVRERYLPPHFLRAHLDLVLRILERDLTHPRRRPLTSPPSDGRGRATPE